MEKQRIEITGKTIGNNLICEGKGKVYIARKIDENNYKISSIHKIK